MRKNVLIDAIAFTLVFGFFSFADVLANDSASTASLGFFVKILATSDDSNGTTETVPTITNDNEADQNETARPLKNGSEVSAGKMKTEETETEESKQDGNDGSDTVVAEEASKKPVVVDGLVLTDSERRVFELTNNERRKRGLPDLRLDRRLMESARRQANWMARTGVFQHGHSGFAENIAMGQRGSLEVVIAWMNSSGHRANMLNSGHGAIGIGSYRSRNGSLYWCQQFAR